MKIPQNSTTKNIKFIAYVFLEILELFGKSEQKKSDPKMLQNNQQFLCTMFINSPLADVFMFSF